MLLAVVAVLAAAEVRQSFADVIGKAVVSTRHMEHGSNWAQAWLLARYLDPRS
jgi:hypothetical protein